MSRFLASETESFLHAFLAFFGGEFADLDNIDIHGIRVSSFGGGGKGLVGMVSRSGVSFGNLVGMLPLGLEGDGSLVPVIDGGGDRVHRHDPVHKGGRDASGEISDKDILVGDACKSRVVLEMGDILNKGQGVGVVLPLGHTFSEEPGDGIAHGVVVFECHFKLYDKVRESSHGYRSSGDGILPKCSCPGEGGSFGHVEEAKAIILLSVS